MLHYSTTYYNLPTIARRGFNNINDEKFQLTVYCFKSIICVSCEKKNRWNTKKGPFEVRALQRVLLKYLFHLSQLRADSPPDRRFSSRYQGVRRAQVKVQKCIKVHKFLSGGVWDLIEGKKICLI